MSALLNARIEQQREMLTDLLSGTLHETARRLGPVMEDCHAVELLLTDEMAGMPCCRFLYVTDAGGGQITASIARKGSDRGYHERNRLQRELLQDAVGNTDFRLSRPCSSNRGEASISAIQVIRNQAGRRIGFLGADYDLRELPPPTGESLENTARHQARDNPAFRDDLFTQQRVESVLDTRMCDVLILMHEMITEHGVFHVRLHFSSNRATIWLTEDPYRYRLLAVKDLTNPATCLAYPRVAYPDQAIIPVNEVMYILDRLRELRLGAGNTFLRSGSLNIFNGMVALNLSCRGSHYMFYREFLEKDMDFWCGLPGTV